MVISAVTTAATLGPAATGLVSFELGSKKNTRVSHCLLFSFRRQDAMQSYTDQRINEDEKYNKIIDDTAEYIQGVPYYYVEFAVIFDA